MQRDVRMNRLRNFLLDNLPLESRRKLLENVVYTTIPANKYIFREGQDADYICVIQKGKVKLSHLDANGRESIIMLLSENDTIWESLFLYEGKFPYSAVTLTETRLCRIYRENFIHILDKWDRLGIPYTLRGTVPPTQERIDNAKRLLRAQ